MGGVPPRASSPRFPIPDSRLPTERHAPRHARHCGGPAAGRRVGSGHRVLPAHRSEHHARPRGLRSGAEQRALERRQPVALLRLARAGNRLAGAAAAAPGPGPGGRAPGTRERRAHGLGRAAGGAPALQPRSSSGSRTVRGRPVPDRRPPQHGAAAHADGGGRTRSPLRRRGSSGLLRARRQRVLDRAGRRVRQAADRCPRGTRARGAEGSHRLPGGTRGAAARAARARARSAGARQHSEGRA
jgi:hypothetical protein